MKWFPILAYHRVVDRIPEDDRMDICMTREGFERQMRLFGRLGYRTLPLEEVGALLASNRPIPPKHFAITFDDGYADTFSIAVPILRDLGFTATSFIVSGQVGHTNTWDEGKGCMAPLMSWSQLQELVQAGLSVGSHTVSHPDLSQLPDERAWHEITHSRDTIERMSGATVRTFCYPYGKHSAATRELVHAAGYDLACNDIWRPEHEQYALARTNTRYYLTPLMTLVRCQEPYFTLRSLVQRMAYPRVLPPSLPHYLAWKWRQATSPAR